MVGRERAADKGREGEGAMKVRAIAYPELPPDRGLHATNTMFPKCVLGESLSESLSQKYLYSNLQLIYCSTSNNI